MLTEYELKLTFTDSEDRIDSIIIERVDGNNVRPESFASTLTRGVSMRASRMDFSPFTNTTTTAAANNTINSSSSNGGGLSSRGQSGVSGGAGGSISTPRGPDSRERKLSVSIQKPPPPSTPRNPTTTSTSSKHSPRTLPTTSSLATSTYDHTLIKECSSDWTCRFCHIHNMPEALNKSMCILYNLFFLFSVDTSHNICTIYTIHMYYTYIHIY